MNDSVLKKEFRSKDVNRVRNLVTKNFTEETTLGVGYEQPKDIHNEGDEWEENGRKWTIKNGLKQTVNKLDSLRKELEVPLVCPKCQTPLDSALHTKMYRIHGICFDCTVEYEGTLRVMGLYPSYEKAMIQGSLKAFLGDMEQWVLENIGQTITHVTEQGDVESWDHNSNKFKEKAINSLQDFVKHVNVHLGKEEQTIYDKP